METGQINMIQMAVDLPSLASATGASPLLTNAGEQDGGAFAGILHSMTPQAPIQPVVDTGVAGADILAQQAAAAEAQAFAVMEMQLESLLTDAAKASVQSSEVLIPETLRGEWSENDGEQLQTENLIPQEVVLNVAWAQPAQVLQMVGRMPESEQNVSVPLDVVEEPRNGFSSTSPETTIKPALSEEPEVARTVVARQLLQAAHAIVEQHVEQALPLPVPEKQTPQFSGEHSRPVAAESLTVATVATVATPGMSHVAENPDRQSVKAPPSDAVHVQQLSAVPASPRKIVAEEAISAVTPARTEMPTQQVMEAYSRPVVVVSKGTSLSPQQRGEVIASPVTPQQGVPQADKAAAFQVVASAGSQPSELAAGFVAPTARIAEPAERTVPPMPITGKVVHHEVVPEVTTQELQQTVARAPERIATALAEDNVNIVVAEETNAVAIPVAKPVMTSAPSIPMQQIMEAYSRPFMVVSNVQGSTIPEQRPLEAAVVEVAAPAVDASAVSKPANQRPVETVAVSLVVPVVDASAMSKPADQRPVETVAVSMVVPAVDISAVSKPAEQRPVEVVAVAVAAPAEDTSAMLKSAEQRPVETVTVPAESHAATLQNVVPKVTGDELLSPRHNDVAPTRDAATANKPIEPGIKEQGVQSAATALSPEAPGQPQQAAPAPVQHAMEAAAIPARTVAKMKDGRALVQEEQLSLQTPAAAEEKAAGNVESLSSVAVKAVAFATPSENAESGDKAMYDRSAVNMQVTPVLPLQQKTETVVDDKPASANTAGSAEHAAKQVSEHLAKHEIKSGSEQIVIRLSPENLGELKVNLRMENQRLSVEIVAENRAVRDSLMQNSDVLKETLAKQNIKMDSFDVSTGGNNGSPGRNQNDWRELVKQQQFNSWKADNGYRLPVIASAPILAASHAKSTHSMVDLHY